MYSMVESMNRIYWNLAWT